MRQVKKLIIALRNGLRDDNFMSMVHGVENLVSKILSLVLIIVILVTLIDLIIFIIKDLFYQGSFGFFEKNLIEIFGLFLNVLIALELLENITAYLRKHIVQVELVIVTALIAIARKIIIFDPKKYDKDDLIALAVAALALSGSYWLIRRANANHKN
jgi:uncharacterized membrane protein (DUF373 family)